MHRDRRQQPMRALIEVAQGQGQEEERDRRGTVAEMHRRKQERRNNDSKWTRSIPIVAGRSLRL